MKTNRYCALDEIRGFTLLSMILYHAVWDLVHLFGFDWKWYQSGSAFIWQQSICWTFILLSGFCQPFGQKKLQRGLQVFLFGLGIMLITRIFMPENRVIFGVLTLIGSCMLLMIPAEKLLKSCRPAIGFAVSFFLFLLAGNVNAGFLGFGKWNLLALPEGLYRNLLTAYFGFPSSSFCSTDYFSLIPWMFLFVSGYFLHRIFVQKNLLSHLKPGRFKPIEWLGRHSMEIYLIHQPVLYLIFTLLFSYRQ